MNISLLDSDYVLEISHIFDSYTQTEQDGDGLADSYWSMWNTEVFISNVRIRTRTCTHARAASSMTIIYIFISRLAHNLHV